MPRSTLQGGGHDSIDPQREDVNGVTLKPAISGEDMSTPVYVASCLLQLPAPSNMISQIQYERDDCFPSPQLDGYGSRL
jgi:hypothetical protein